MSTLRISDAPLLPDVDGTEKIPTGGRGDYAISVDQIKSHIFQDIGKELVGLGNVDNTSDLDKPVSTAQQAALDLKADKTYVDTNLDLKADKTNVYTRSETTLALSTKADLVGGVIPSDQLPSYVDDVVEYTTNTLPIVGESGKIYITTDTNRTWRWSGNQYVEISNGGISDSTLRLQTPRKIANVDFDGTQNIDIPHNNLVNRDANGSHSASAISDASGKNQQEINTALTDGIAYVEWFGDTTIDATNAINMCLLYCQTYNKIAKSISGKTYPCSSTVRIATSCDFTGSTFVFPASIATAAVDIRKEVSGASVLFENVRIKLPIITNNRTYGTVPVAGSIGVKITGLRDSEVIFNSIRGFENNLQLYSNDVNVYIAYNDFKFNGLFVSSKVNIHMLIEGQGWINQCTWYGGHFAQVSVDRAKYTAINLKLTKLAAGGNNPPNGHTFIGCALEGDFYRTIDYDFDPALNISYYSCNTFVNCRFEAALALRFNSHSLYDTFICCSGLGDATFIDNVRPNAVGSPRFTNFKIDVAMMPGSTGFRTNKSTHLFQAGNSSGALVLGAGFGNTVNGGILGSGAYTLYNSSDVNLNHPIVKISLEAGRQSISMGNGTADPTDRLTWFNVNDWRHTFNLSPTADNASTLGDSARKYANIHAVKATLTGGIGVFGTAPPTTKRSITGKKAPTTIEEQNAVLDSIVSALVAYGLVSDDRTV